MACAVDGRYKETEWRAKRDLRHRVDVVMPWLVCIVRDKTAEIVMNQQIDRLLDQLSDATWTNEVGAGYDEWLRSVTDAGFGPLLQALAKRRPPPHGSIEEERLGRFLAALVPWQQAAAHADGPLDVAGSDSIAAIYTNLGPTSRVRHHLLCLLATARSVAQWNRLVALMVDDPPADPTHAAMPLAMLVRRADSRLGQLFPGLLEAMQHPSIAPAVLDLANYVTRERIVAEHPAKPRAGQLIGLLGRVVNELEMIEESHDLDGQRLKATQQKVSDSVDLLVSLCDALAWIGDPSAIGPLRRTMQLQHRRLQVEAASALARLDVAEGTRRLIELAGEPVVRLRVLAYAEELGLLQEVDELHRNDVARAEAKLASWLAQPTTMGLPPHELQLVDCREQFWPGSEDPVWCCLFRITYNLPRGTYHNIGIAAPLVHCMTADLTGLPIDEIYAAYAGWQARHDEIGQQDVDQLDDRQRDDVAALERRLRQAGYGNIVAIRLGRFFGEKVLVAAAQSRGASGVAVVDSQHVQWYPTSTTGKPIGPDQAYCIYKGRHLLRAFNH